MCSLNTFTTERNEVLTYSLIVPTSEECVLPGRGVRDWELHDLCTTQIVFISRLVTTNKPQIIHYRVSKRNLSVSKKQKHILVSLTGYERNIDYFSECKHQNKIGFKSEFFICENSGDMSFPIASQISNTLNGLHLLKVQCLCVGV